MQKCLLPNSILFFHWRIWSRPRFRSEIEYRAKKLNSIPTAHTFSSPCLCHDWMMTMTMMASTLIFLACHSLVHGSCVCHGRGHGHDDCCFVHRESFLKMNDNSEMKIHTGLYRRQHNMPTYWNLTLLLHQIKSYFIKQCQHIIVIVLSRLQFDKPTL